MTRLRFGNSFKVRKNHFIYDDTKAVANFNCFEFDDRENIEVAYDFYRIAQIVAFACPTRCLGDGREDGKCCKSLSFGPKREEEKDSLQSQTLKTSYFFKLNQMLTLAFFTCGICFYAIGKYRIG